jgi:AraC-like DNA-binding protein
MSHDALSDILSALRLRGTIYFRTEFNPPWGVAVPAFRNVARFHLAARSSCWVRVAGEDRPVALAQGDLIVIPHGAAHVLADEPDRDATTVDDVLQKTGYEGGGALVYGGRDEGRSTRLICGHFEFDDAVIHPLLDALPRYIHITGSETLNHVWLENAMKFVSVESLGEQPGSEAIVHRLSEIIFIQVVRIYVERAGGAAGCLAGITDPQIGRALGAMHSSPATAWTVERLAQEAGMSRTSFAVRFARLVGMTPLNYLTHWRMQEARRLLRQTRDPVLAIAECAGYHSEAAFNRAFKKRFAATPAAYRRQLKQP